MKIIAFEGLDGTGKGTQARYTYEKLNKKYNCLYLDFPNYDSFFGKHIGDLLSGKIEISAKDIDPKSMALFYACDRLNEFKQKKEVLVNVDFLVLNRYTLSNMAYQGTRSSDSQAFYKHIYELEHNIFELPVPDCYFILDVDYENRMDNLANKGVRDYVDGLDVYEKDLEFLKIVRKHYHEASKLYENSFFIRCSENGVLKNIENINKDITQKLVELFEVSI